MAAPASPTIDSICMEALRRAGYEDISASLLDRAKKEWLEEVKMDIASRKEWKTLEVKSVLISSANIQKYPYPSGAQKILDIRFYDGETKGTAQAGTSSSITLASDETISKETAEGKLIFITGGTGKSQYSRIVDYDENTKIATVSPSWTTTPDNTSTYMIATIERFLSFKPHETIRAVTSTGYPSLYGFYDEEIYFAPIPDASTYAFLIKYLADVTLLDLDSADHSRLLREWRPALVLGVCSKALHNNDDTQEIDVLRKYERIIGLLMIEDARKRRIRGQLYAKSMGLPRR